MVELMPRKFVPDRCLARSRIDYRISKIHGTGAGRSLFQGVSIKLSDGVYTPETWFPAPVRQDVQ